MAFNFFIFIKKCTLQRLFAFVIVLLLLGSKPIKAQNEGLSIGTSSTIEAVAVEDSIGVAMYKIQVKNQSADWFWGDINIYNQINTTPPLNPLVQYSLYGIPPKDSLLFVAYQPLEVQYGYKIGDNIVVIWPSSANASTLDSLNITLHISKNNILNASILQNAVLNNQIYYNSLNNSIVIPTALHPQIQSVKVFDLQANLIQSSNVQNYLPTLLPLPQDVRNGIYFVHFMLKNGKKYVLKIVK